MERPLLNDPEKYPDKELLEEILNTSYSAFDELMRKIEEPEYALVPEWRYYKDGKAWLCKVCYKKKTVFWLSVWDGFFKTAFYFTEKHIPAIMNLEINQSVKDNLNHAKPIGKMIPLIFNVYQTEDIKDIAKVALFKKGIK